MSFGVSVGDFIVVSKLIADLVTALRSASRDEYKSLADELHRLQGVLQELQHLTYNEYQRTEAEALKAAALSCKTEICDFTKKVVKFEGMVNQQSKITMSEKAKLYFRKVEWGFSMQDAADRMRVRMAAHVAYLNMRLNILGLSTTAYSSSKLDQATTDFEDRLTQIQGHLSDVRRNTEVQSNFLREQKSYLQTITDVGNSILPQFASLRQVVFGVWMTNAQIVSLLRKASLAPPAPDPRFTWAQAPVRFEDALGRVFPIASEYSWSKVLALIQDQFASGPVAKKVSAGEFCVFASDDPLTTFGDADLLIPGSSLTMAMVVGIHRPIFHNICPRPGCLSRDFQDKRNGIEECISCGVNFHIGVSGLQRPFRFPEFEVEIDDVQPGDLFCTSDGRFLRKTYDLGQVNTAVRSMRKQRRLYKHIRLSLGAEMPRFLFSGGSASKVHSVSDTQDRPSPRLKPPSSQPLKFNQGIDDMWRDCDLFKRLSNLVAEETGFPQQVDDIVHVPFENLGVDSLMLLELTFLIEKEFGADVGHFFQEADMATLTLADLFAPDSTFPSILRK